MQEIWKDIPSFEGMYAVSNLGRIKSLNRINQYGRTNREKMLALSRLPDTKYRYATLYREGKGKMMKVHRAVAMAFLGEIKKGFVVDHIDGDRENNRLENLQIITQRKNTAKGRRSQMNRNKTSRFTGVVKIKKTGLFAVSKKFGPHNLRIGHFMNEEMAAYVYSCITSYEEAMYYKKNKTLLNTMSEQ